MGYLQTDLGDGCYSREIEKDGHHVFSTAERDLLDKDCAPSAAKYSSSGAQGMDFSVCFPAVLSTNAP